MQFLEAVNWMRTSLGSLAAVVGSLRDVMEELLAGTKRKKRVENNRMPP